MGIIRDIIDRLCLDRVRNERITDPDIIGYIVDKKLIGYECLICLEEFNEEEVVSLIKCGHIYHTHCLYSWFLKKKTCPLCDEELIID
jgi:hypothetical protein